MDKLKVKGHLLVPGGFVCLQNPLYSAVNLLPVGWTGLTGLESDRKTQRNAMFTTYNHIRILTYTCIKLG